MSFWINAVLPGVGVPAEAPPPISTGEKLDLADNLGFEQATVFLFYRPNSALEKQFVEGIVTAAAGRPVAVRTIHLNSGKEPIAAQYKIDQTPQALVYDRRGRQTGKASTPDEIVALARQASDVGRIDWAMPRSPQADEIKRLMNLDDPRQLPGIMRAMSLRPQAMMGMIQMARMMHFSDGALKVRTKEMIATYVSSLNQCKFCLSSHAQFLANAGQAAADVDAIGLGTPDKSTGLDAKEKALLGYVKKLTQEPWKVADFDIDRLRTAGWTDPEIYEATFDIALFAFFNRMANAYGLDFAPDSWRPPKTA